MNLWRSAFKCVVAALMISSCNKHPEPAPVRPSPVIHILHGGFHLHDKDQEISNPASIEAIVTGLNTIDISYEQDATTGDLYSALCFLGQQGIADCCIQNKSEEDVHFFIPGCFDADLSDIPISEYTLDEFLARPTTDPIPVFARINLPNATVKISDIEKCLHRIKSSSCVSIESKDPELFLFAGKIKDWDNATHAYHAAHPSAPASNPSHP